MGHGTIAITTIDGDQEMSNLAPTLGSNVEMTAVPTISSKKAVSGCRTYDRQA